jgi:2-C-methyl-D-erythritol 4-phosphate cytidylyltransferase
LAGGSGLRFCRGEIPKQLVKIAGKTVLEHTIEKFEKNTKINEIIIVANPNYHKNIDEIVKKRKFRKVKKIVNGGKTRQESSFLGLRACNVNKTKYVLLHDAVRPFVNDKIINDILRALKTNKAVDVAIPLSDTLIKVDNNKYIENIPRRADFMRGQTPQGFGYDTILKAHFLALKDKDYSFSDDCGIVLKYKLAKVYVVDGAEDNIKITHRFDIHIADKLFQVKNMVLDNNVLDLTKLKNKKIIIIGHSSGIGKEIFSICTKSKATVGGYSISNGYDIRNEKLINKTLKEFVEKNGKIDFLISTAGILKLGTLENYYKKDIVDQIEINYIAQVFLVKMAIKYMSKNSSIALFASSSYTRGRANYSIYSSTKAAIVNFVQGVAEEIIEKGIRINAMSPTRANTPMRKNIFGKELKNTLLDPKDIAVTTLVCCASRITGQIIDIIMK